MKQCDLSTNHKENMYLGQVGVELRRNYKGEL